MEEMLIKESLAGKYKANVIDTNLKIQVQQFPQRVKILIN